MKLFKSALSAANVFLFVMGGCFLMTQIPESNGRSVLFVILVCMEILNWGYYIYFRKRFIEFSEEVCRNTERIMRHEKERFHLNKETLTSKMVMELEKMEDVVSNRLQESERERDRLKHTISEISHQLKTPLSNICMYHDMVSDPDITVDEAESFMGIIRQQLEKLEFLIDSLIKSSRLESEMMKMNIDNNSIFRTMELAVNGIVQKADKKDIDISFNCHKGEKALHDIKWTAEAVENILDNAVKYTEKGGNICINVISGEMYVEIKVQDTGRGISPEHYNDIFKRFYREKTAPLDDGLGLGLYIARNIIALQGGYIMVHSIVGQGSCFSVFLPKGKSR